MANQPTSQQQFRFWFPYRNQTPTPHPPPSSSSPLEVPTPTSIPIQSESTSRSDIKPQFTSGKGSRATLASPSPLPGPPSSPSPSRKSDQSPERRRQEQQRATSTRRPSQPSSPTPPGSRKEYTTLAISSSSSSSLSQAQPTPTQEVSETISSLQTEKPEKENNETQSLNPQLASPTQESITSQAQEDLESESIPIIRTIPDETPLFEREIEQVQEKTTTHAEPIANTHPSEISKLKENPDRDVETQESRKKSILPQVEEESEIVLEHQHMLVEEKPGLVSEENTMEVIITKEINPIKQNPETIAEAIQQAQPKVDLESHEPTAPYISNEKSNSKTELNTSIVQPDCMQTQVQPETIDSSKLENMNGISGKEQTNLMPNVPQASPTIAGENVLKEVKGDSNWDEKMNNEHSQDAGNERTRIIIHLAGKNHGASMYIGHEELKTSIQKINKVDNQKEDSKDNNATRKEESQVNNEVPSSTSINCSVQSIINSILHESSCSQDNPGVHLIISRKPTETFNSIDEMEQFVL